VIESHFESSMNV